MRRIAFAGLLLLWSPAAPAQTVIEAVRYLNGKSPTFGIQSAIDALPPEGGVVQLPGNRIAP